MYYGYVRYYFGGNLDKWYRELSILFLQLLAHLELFPSKALTFFFFFFLSDSVGPDPRSSESGNRPCDNVSVITGENLGASSLVIGLSQLIG